MNWRKTILLFLLNAFDDGIAALWVRSCARSDAFWATILSGILTLTIAFSVKSYVKDIRYLAPILIGSMLGCYLSVRFG